MNGIGIKDESFLNYYLLIGRKYRTPKRPLGKGWFIKDRLGQYLIDRVMGDSAKSGGTVG
jgi:hypothetical protein